MKTFILIAVLIVAAWPVRASVPSPDSQFTRYLAQDGLTVGAVQTITQDGDGFIWIGGFDGLARFDGYRFEKFVNDTATDVVASNAIFDVLHVNGAMWLATRGGLSRFDAETNRFEHFFTGIPARDAIRQITHQDGILWLATSGGLVKFTIASEQFSHISTIPYGVHSVTNGADGDIWLGTNSHGLLRFNTRSLSITQYGHDAAKENSLLNNVVWDVHYTRSGSVFAGTRAGLSELLADGTFINYLHDPSDPDSLSAKEVSDIAEDDSGVIWVATSNGLSILDRESLRFVRLSYREHDPRSLATSNAYKIFFDKNGDAWVSTFPTGVNFLNRADFAFRTTRPDSTGGGLNYRSVLALHEDASGSLWVGTDGGGVNVFDGRGVRYISRKNGDLDNTQVSSKAILDILSDPLDGHLWIGTWAGGLNRLNPKTGVIEHIFFEPGAVSGLPGNNVWVLEFDAENALWVGTVGGGLARYDREKQNFAHFTEQHGFDTSVVWDIKLTTSGLWIGTDAGLKRYNPQTGSFTSFMHVPGDTRSLSSNTVFIIHEDTHGQLWLGTRGGGVNRFDPTTGRVTRYSNGLPHQNVTSIEEDEEGNLWLGTHGGLARFNPVTNSFRSFDVKNGLQSNYFNIKASAKLKNGELIFGGTDGFTRFYPSQLGDDHDDYSVYLRELRIANLPVTPKEGADAVLTRAIHKTDWITLDHTQNVFSIEYAATSYRNARLMQYAYQLEGFDEHWQRVGTQRSATYTNLNAGRYVFRVKASLDGNWGDADTSLIIDVRPAPWLSWWAITVYLVMAIGLVYWAIDTQRRKKLFFKEQNTILEAKVATRTAELVQKEKLAALGSLVAGVSHELNTPIGNGLTVASSIAENTVEFEKLVKNGLTKAQLDTFISDTKEGSQLIVNSLRRAADLVASFKQVAVDRTSEQRREFTLASVLYEIKMLMRNTLKNSPISLEIYHGTDIRMQSYPGPLEQVLSNLINNALVHAFEGRETGRIVIRTSELGDAARIEVEDDGNGIDEMHLKRIFEPFFTTKLGSGGSGLGLHIVHNLLIGTLGGTIDVTADIGRGTKFILRLPLIAPHPSDTLAINNEQGPSP